MTENVDNIQADLGDSTSEVDKQNVDNIQDKPDPAELAAKQGHKGYEQYIADGGKPELYQSPEVFLALKEPLKALKQKSKQLDRQTQEFEERLAGQRAMHAEQLKLQREQLMANRDAAIVDADVEGARAYQQQIDNLQRLPEQTPTQGKSQAIQDWEDRNPWVMKQGPRTAYANAQFTQYLTQGYSETDALNLVDSDIAREFPPVNTTARTAPQIEGGTKPGSKPKGRDLTMNDLTQQERSIWRTSPDMWDNDPKKFLQSVKDTRGDK